MLTRTRSTSVLPVLIASLAVSVSAQSAGKLVTFAVPGAGNGPGQGTMPTAVNSTGDVTGQYRDANGIGHGFLRYSSGNIETFDPPGAQVTIPNGLNDSDTVVGVFADANFYSHGFLRTSDGTITIFDAPGSALSPNYGTDLLAINSSGVILGYYNDPGIVQGFVIHTDGTYQFLSVQGNGNPTGAAINNYSAVTGTYTYPGGTSRGLIQTPLGAAYSFDVNSSPEVQGTAINDLGATVGIYGTAGGYTGFVRSRNGQLASLYVPYAGAELATWPTGINNSGLIAGWYSSGTYYAAFLRSPEGTVTSFRVQSAFETKAVGVGNGNAVTGHFCVQTACSDSVAEGFLLTP